MILKNIKTITWIYLFILVLGSVLPLNSGSSSLNNTYIVEVRSDYLLHVLVLLPLPVLLSLSLRSRTRIWLRVVLLGILMVVFCESVQMLIPYRAFNINDMVANGAGALIGLVPAVLVWRYFSGFERSTHSSKE